jgi:hypothetical protein
LKENVVPICPDIELSCCRTVFFNGVEMSSTVLSLRAGTRYFYPATVASGTGRKKKSFAKI